MHLHAPRVNEIDDPASADRASAPARAGFVVSKAVGGAVVRNKVKRRLRELMRSQLRDLPDGTNVVVRALPTSSGRTYADLAGDLSRAIDAAKRPRRVTK